MRHNNEHGPVIVQGWWHIYMQILLEVVSEADDFSRLSVSALHDMCAEFCHHPWFMEFNTL
jgi:hypothetical protein